MSAIDYVGLSDYAKAWPDKLVSFFRDHCADDEYNPFVRGFWEHCKEPDKDGPGIEGWLES